MLVRSADDGKTWSEPVNCFDEEDYYCVVNDRIVEGENRIDLDELREGFDLDFPDSVVDMLGDLHGRLTL